MLYHLLVLFFKQTLYAKHVCSSYFKWYVLLLYLTYHPFLRLVTLSVQILRREECHWCILWQLYDSF